METETINPIFMKALIKCYLLQRQARKRVFHNRRFFQHLLQVFKWRRRIRKQIDVIKLDKTHETSNSYLLPSHLAAQECKSNVSKSPAPKIKQEPVESNSDVQQQTVHEQNNPQPQKPQPEPDQPLSEQSTQQERKGSGEKRQRPKKAKSTNSTKRADIDIVRRNLWLMIARKDIIQAYRRRLNFREQKLLKTRAIAYRCQTQAKLILNSTTSNGTNH